MIGRGIFRRGDVLKHVTVDGVRLHLRIDERKLWVNNTYVLYLNKSATRLLECFIDACYKFDINVEDRAVKSFIGHSRRMDRQIIRRDLNQLLGIVNSFARDEIPAHLVGLKYVKASDRKVPTRMDISLSYDCNNHCPHCYLPSHVRKVTSDELSTAQWGHVIDKLWKLGIPQIVFTGGECTLRKDLPALALYARQFNVGIITNGTGLTSRLAKSLRKSEVDWVQITLESPTESVHDGMVGRKGAFRETVAGICNCVNAGLLVSINTTITKRNYEHVRSLISFGKSLGVNIFSCNALINSGDAMNVITREAIHERKLNIVLTQARDFANHLGVSFNWFLPTCYNNLNPVELGFGVRACSACSINMMIEPNGDVIPCQSWPQFKLGNIMTDSWKKIWNQPLAKRLRKHELASKECRTCEHYVTCGGACPLSDLHLIDKRSRC